MYRFFILFLILASSCGQHPEQKKPTVLVSLAPYAFFVDKIAGDTLQVQTLIPQDANPHLYEAAPTAIQKMLQADVWFCLGEPFEPKILRVFKQNNPSFVSCDLSFGIDLLPQTEHTCTEDHHHSHEDYDRHLWLSPKIAYSQVQTMIKVLSELYPQHASVFNERGCVLLKQLQVLDSQIAQKLASCRGDAILTSHPAFAYFCKEYGLKQLSVEFEGKDPRPQDVARTVKEAQELNIRAVLTQVQYQNKGALLIAEKLNAPTYEVDPYSYDYINNLSHISSLIAHENSH